MKGNEAKTQYGHKELLVVNDLNLSYGGGGWEELRAVQGEAGHIHKQISVHIRNKVRPRAYGNSSSNLFVLQQPPYLVTEQEGQDYNLISMYDCECFLSPQEL